jgi:hypothetical protein
MQYVPLVVAAFGAVLMLMMARGREVIVPIFFLPWVAFSIDLGFSMEVSEFLMLVAIFKAFLTRGPGGFSLPAGLLLGLYVIISLFSAYLTLTFGPAVPDFALGSFFQNGWGRVITQTVKLGILTGFLATILGNRDDFDPGLAIKALIYSSVILAVLGIIQFFVFYGTGVDLFPVGIFMDEELARSAVLSGASTDYLRITAFAGEPKGLGVASAIALLLLFYYGSALGFRRGRRRLMQFICLVALVLTASASGVFILLIAGGMAMAFKFHRQPMGTQTTGWLSLGILWGATALFLMVASADATGVRYYDYTGTNLLDAVYERLLTRVELLDTDQLIMESFLLEPFHLIFGYGMGLQHHYIQDLIPREQWYYLGGNIAPAKSGVTEWVGNAGLLGGSLVMLFLARLVPVWRRADNVAENAAERRQRAATQGTALALILAATLSLFVAPVVFVLLAVLKRTEARVDRPPRPAITAMRIAA